MRVNILTQRSLTAHHYLHPLRVYRRAIEKLGFSLRFFYAPNAKSLSNCDTLLILRRHVTPSLIEHWRPLVPRIVYFDLGDSTGLLKSRIMELVDVYAKPQVLRDRSLYLTDMYRRMLWPDFYNREYHIHDPDENMMRWPLPSESELAKITLAWNYGMGDWKVDRESRVRRGLRICFPSQKPITKNVVPQLIHKDIDITYRVGIHPVPTIQHQRNEVRKRIESIAGTGRYRVAFGGRVSHAVYLNELRRAWIAPSPFGYGEICQRDFEAMRQGAILFKPNMEHLETYPDYYLNGETYIGFKWDFSDFEEKLLQILEDSSAYLRIIHAAHDFFFRMISEKNAEMFAAHFASVICFQPH